MLALKVTTVGTSAGLILTKEAPDGGYRLTPYDPDFERQMAPAEDIMREDRDVLHALAE